MKIISTPIVVMALMVLPRTSFGSLSNDFLGCQGDVWGAKGTSYIAPVKREDKKFLKNLSFVKTVSYKTVLI
jgi:hypothetical protein